MKDGLVGSEMCIRDRTETERQTETERDRDRETKLICPSVLP